MKKNNIKFSPFIALIVLPVFSSAYADLPAGGFNYGKASAAYIDTSSASGVLDRIYFGGSFGSSEANDYCAIANGCEDSDSSWKGFAGYNITDMLAAELAYTNIGDFHKSGTISDVSAFSVSGVANVPINGSFGLFGKAGLSRWSSENTEGDTDGTGVSYGIGAKVNLSETMKLRAEWERIPSIETSHIEDSNVDMFSIGIEMSSF